MYLFVNSLSRAKILVSVDSPASTLEAGFEIPLPEHTVSSSVKLIS